MSPDIHNTAVFQKEHPCDFSKKKKLLNVPLFGGREAGNICYVFLGDLNVYDSDQTVVNTTSQALINHSM